LNTLSRRSKDNIFVFVFKDGSGALLDEFLILVFFGTLLSFLGVKKRLFNFLGLLKISNLLKSVKVLTRLLVQLFINVLDDEFDSRYDDELERVDSPVGDLDDLVESDELSLQ
jgi:hypothetical protein